MEQESEILQRLEKIDEKKDKNVSDYRIFKG